MSAHSTEHSAEHHPAMTKRTVWNVFWVLLGITAIEFIIALAIPTSFMPQGIKNFIYIALTLAKAFYIVAYFMHLKFEKLGLIYCIVVPTIFIIGLVAAMLYEGTFWNLIR